MSDRARGVTNGVHNIRVSGPLGFRRNLTKFSHGLLLRPLKGVNKAVDGVNKAVEGGQ